VTRPSCDRAIDTRLRSVPIGIVGGTVVLVGESITNDGEWRRHTSWRRGSSITAIGVEASGAWR
jgi:hypothetical protein